MQFSIVHELIGRKNRLRVRAQRAFSQKIAQKFLTQLQQIAGLTEVFINSRTGSILVHYADNNARQAFLSCLKIATENHTLSVLPRCDTNKHIVSINDRMNRIYNMHTCGALPVNNASNTFFAYSIQTLQRSVLHLTRLFVGNSFIGATARFLLFRAVLPFFAKMLLAMKNATPYLLKGVESLQRGHIGVDVLDAAAILVSLLRRDFNTVSLLTFLLRLGDMLETWTRQESRASLAQSLALNIEKVWVERNGQEEEIYLDALCDTDLVIVRAGSTIPVDGCVECGEALVNQSSMTGEPLPVCRSAGASVFAGTVIEEGELRIRATRVGDDTRLQHVISFIEDSQKLKANVESRALHLADMAVPFSFLLAGVVWLVTRNPMRAASVLLVDYSCTLRLATPLAILSAIRNGLQHGVLTKGGVFLEALAEADTVVFDKTGTLTESRPAVSEVVAAQGYTQKEILRLAACLEEHFPHPVARAVVQHAEQQNLSHREEHTSVEYIVAHGIASSWRDKRVIFGSQHFVEHDEHVDVQCLEEDIHRFSNQGMSILYLAIDGQLAGIISIKDTLRAEAASVIQALKRTGIKRTLMLTGDNSRTAATLCTALQLDEYRAEVLPIDKAQIIMELQAQGHKVIMVGDGINDAPALSAAEVGVSLRDGADLACEVADVILTNCNLNALLAARLLGQMTIRRIHHNFVLNMGLNSIFLALGLFSNVSPALSAVLHNATTVGITLNAMRPYALPMLSDCEVKNA